MEMDGWMALFVVFGVSIAIVLVALGSAQLTLTRMSPEALDLRSVRDAMMEKHGWTIERADAAEAEYVRFLTLLGMKPKFMVVPWLDANGRDDLDQFWHQHILDTQKYAADCKAVFGQMIHHNPHVLRGSDQEKDAVEKTQRLYTRTFNSGTYGSDADPAYFSGCSACATESSGSHSHSGHDGHSGDSGSHSGDSGGHSCGGHGCGHGCGSSCGGH